MKIEKILIFQSNTTASIFLFQLRFNYGITNFLPKKNFKKWCIEPQRR